MRDQQTKFSVEDSFMSRERAASLSSSSSWRASDMDTGPHSKLSASTISLFASDVGRPDINGNRYENGLFSSSFSDILDKKSERPYFSFAAKHLLLSF
jgi:hypothetical protein